MSKTVIKYANHLGKCYICGKEWCKIHDKHLEDCSCIKDSEELKNISSKSKNITN